MFKKILIANRGEIACRVIKTARRMGIATVAVYSDADARALHVRLADEAVHIGGAASKESYLKADAIIAAAVQTGAEAVHPGYGFLSENEGFATACAKAGLTFIGPGPDAINAMGLKDRAKAIMEKAGVPVVPGYRGENQKPDHLKSEAGKIGYPVLIKAVAGGGGKGMRLVEREADFAEALASCQREAQSAFGNPHVLIERYIQKPRHIEVQVFGDTHGNAVYLHERDCSLQRRHQKIVEEAPAPGLPDKVRKALGAASVKAVKALKYTNAGTIEFIMDAGTHDFFFMEMNTRLQVEHPVTEMITGLDLVEWQLRVAAGEALPLAQKDVALSGHAFEVRLYAEDPAHQFLPQCGKITHFTAPESARVDTGVEQGDSVTIHYDPMIAKIIVHGVNRDAAVQAMQNALAQTELGGIVTNQEFLANIFRQPDFIAAAIDTGFIPRHEADLIPESYGRPERGELALAAVHFLSPESEGIWNNGDNWRMNAPMTRPLTLMNRDHGIALRVTCRGNEYDIAAEGQNFTVVVENDVLTIGGERVDGRLIGDTQSVTIFNNGRVVRLSLPHAGTAGEDGAGEGRITAPMPGRIVSVLVGQGDSVAKDQPLLIMEAMKMEMTIRANFAGVVDELPVVANDQVGDGALLVLISEQEPVGPAYYAESN